VNREHHKPSSKGLKQWKLKSKKRKEKEQNNSLTFKLLAQ
jgi:hypothetical protein